MTTHRSHTLLGDMFLFGMIGSLGIGMGIAVNTVPPLFVVIGSALFAILTIVLYTSISTALVKKDVFVSDAVETTQKNTLLFHLFTLSFFLSITIPKSGRTVSNIPITTANMFILLALIYWSLNFISTRKSLSSIPVFKMIIAFIVYGVLAAGIGFFYYNPPRFIILDFVAFIGFIPVYFLVCHCLNSEKQLKRVLVLILFSSLLVSGYGILQKRMGFARVTIPGITEQMDKETYAQKWNIIEGGSSKVYSTFQNGNIFGNHLALIIPFLGGILLTKQTTTRKFIVAVIFLITGYALILTYSRGALVGTFSGLLMLGIIAKKIRLKALLVMLIICLLFGVFLHFYADRPELARYDIRRIATDPERFSAGRFERVREVVRGFSKLPLAKKLFGVGFGGILVSPRGWVFQYVDNLYLTFLFKMGLVGSMIFGAMLISLFFELLRLRSKIPDTNFQALMNGGIAGMIGSLVHNLADTLWFFPPLAVNFWFITGITVSIGIIASQPNKAEQQPIKSVKKNFSQSVKNIPA